MDHREWLTTHPQECGQNQPPRGHDVGRRPLSEALGRCDTRSGNDATIKTYRSNQFVEPLPPLCLPMLALASVGRRHQPLVISWYTDLLALHSKWRVSAAHSWKCCAW